MDTYSLKDTRDNLAEIVNRVMVTGEEVLVTKHGKPAVKITKAISSKAFDRRAWEKAVEETAGIWADRDDIGDPVEWVNKLRAPRFKL